MVDSNPWQDRSELGLYVSEDDLETMISDVVRQPSRFVIAGGFREVGALPFLVFTLLVSQYCRFYFYTSFTLWIVVMSLHKDSQRFIPILIKGTSRGGWVVQGRELWHLFRGCANSRWLHTMLGWEYSVAKGAGWCANIIVIIISIIHLLFLLSWIMYDYAVCVYIYIYSDSLHIS